MTSYDFFINRIDDGDALIVEKSDVADGEIGRVIEALEALPYGAADEQTIGRNGLIKIKQVK